MLEYRYKGRWNDIQVHLTNWCNHKCIHCYTASRSDNTHWLPMASYREIIRYASRNQHSVLRLLGGEIVAPDMRILEYVEVARQSGCRLALCTNGYYSDAWTSEEVDPEQFQEIIVSLYGLEVTHNRVTDTADSFRKALTTLKYLTHRKKRSFEITINFVLLAINVVEMLEFIRFVAALGVDEIKLLCLSPLGRSIAPDSSIFHSQSCDLGNPIVEILRGGVHDPKGRRIRIVAERLGFPDASGSRERYPTCRLHKESMITIDPSGNVYPCHLMIYQDSYSLGNLEHSSLDDILDRYSKQGGGEKLESDLLLRYRSCPAHASVLEGLSPRAAYWIRPCPLHLELL